MLGATDSGFAPEGAVAAAGDFPPGVATGAPGNAAGAPGVTVGGLPNAGATGSGFAPEGAVAAAGDFPPGGGVTAGVPAGVFPSGEGA
jgi:hypothetical protein